MPKPPERIAVVGWGSLSPLGDDADSTWSAVCARQSGIQSIQEPWADDLNVRIAGRVAETAFAGLAPLLRRRSDRCAQLALLAGRQAWAKAEPHRRGLDPTRIAVVLGLALVYTIVFRFLRGHCTFYSQRLGEMILEVP